MLARSGQLSLPTCENPYTWHVAEKDTSLIMMGGVTQQTVHKQAGSLLGTNWQEKGSCSQIKISSHCGFLRTHEEPSALALTCVVLWFCCSASAFLDVVTTSLFFFRKIVAGVGFCQRLASKALHKRKLNVLVYHVVGLCDEQESVKSGYILGSPNCLTIFLLRQLEFSVKETLANAPYF